MAIVLNMGLAPGDVAPPSDIARTFHAQAEGGAPTPLREAGRLAAELGFDSLAVKDESKRMGLPAFKILGASWAIERAIRRAPGATTLLAASAGNHGRAVAREAARRGLGCRVYLPARSAAERREAIRGEGAEVVVVDGDYEQAVVLAATAADGRESIEIADVGDSDPARDVIDGYATLFAELGEQHEPPLDVLLVPVGVGSLGAAAARFAIPRNAHVIAVEPESAACLAASIERGAPVRIATPGTTMAGMDCAEVSAGAWPDLRAGVSAVITVGESELPWAAAELRAIGIEPGECSAAALAAARSLASEEAAPTRMALSLPRALRAVAIATEGPTSGRVG
ncbi:pyridoxal-phosphate dependent enzyme [Thermoleophilia bacterium SCSIO 60948]|nr:pyridoxal-phosphate dependent enzyme [Thermoleophilia bacterium SCSIO 60948]